ncbi:hypothetical protein LZL87_007127 [Fusarium oxysporum]|nr:hypothetical protein LZL87_007127 [Fusarium oxysporum]
MLKEYLVAGILLASPLLAVAQDLIPPILEKADSFVEETWSVDSSPKVIYIDKTFASVSDKDGLTLIPPTAHEFATTFQDDLAKITGSNWTLKRVDSLPNNASGISLGSYTGESSDLLYENGKSTSEGYEIIINSNRVFIGGSGARGMWWGTRTFLQLLLAGNGTITSTLGRDAPAYATRGYMLDAGRKWYSKDFLKELCSYASFFKMNEFHYHLSDNYPLNRGKNESWRDVYSHFSLLPEDKSLRGILHGRENETLSKDDFAELQSHCASRGVTVIPEIEAPGHSLYLTKWKPELALAKKDLLNLTHPDTLPTVQSIWKEFLPWFKTKEVHIGADEYDAELADDYITFVNKMSRFINSTSNKRSRIWGTHEPSKRNQTIDKAVIIQHWQYGQSDPVQLVKDGYDVINSEDWWAYTSLKNDHMPILPARYPQFFNESRVFNFADKEEWQWTPADFNPVKMSLQLKSDEERLRGATLAAWNDNGPDATTQLEAYYSMRRGIALVGGRAWSGSRGPKLLEETSDTSIDFYSPRAPGQNLDRVVSLDKENGTLLSWTRSDGGEKEVRLGYDSKGMNYTLTLSIAGTFTLTGPDNTLSLDKEGNMVFTADGWEYPLRKVTKDDALDLDPGAPGRIWVNTSSTHKPVKVSTPVNITLVTDVLHGTVVYSDGEVDEAKTRYILSSRVALLEVLKKVVTGPARGPVCCLMDRLDECSVDATRWLLARLRSMVDGPQTRTASHHHLKLTLGSREVPGLEGSPCLRLEEAKSDIALVARVINSKMEKHSIFQNLNPDFVAEVKDTLRQRYDGIFLWVRFAIDELVQVKTETEMCEILRGIPIALGSLYTRTLAHVKPQYQQKASRLLCWVTQVDGGPGIPERASSFSFTTHAMHFWAEHARDIVQYSSAIFGVDRPFFQNDDTRLVRRRWWVEFTDDGSAGDELGMHMDYGGTPLHVYTALGMLLWVEKLLSESYCKAQVDQIDANSFTALQHASRSSSEESRMPRAQRHGNPMPHSISITPLHVEQSALDANSWDQEVLLRHDAYINAPSKAGQHILHTVAQSPGTADYPIQLTAKLLQHGAYADAVDSSGNPALHTAILNKACAAQAWEGGFLYILLQNGTDHNALDGNGACALHLAAAHRVHAGVIITGLPRHGSDPRTRCRDRRCVLHYLAKFMGSPDVAKQLVNLGLNPNARNEHSQTPLLHATVAGHVMMLRFLCEYGVDVDTLSYAVRLKSVNVGQILLEHGTDPHHHDHSGRIALHHEAAYKLRHEDAAYSRNLCT